MKPMPFKEYTESMHTNSTLKVITVECLTCSSLTCVSHVQGKQNKITFIWDIIADCFIIRFNLLLTSIYQLQKQLYNYQCPPLNQGCGYIPKDVVLLHRYGYILYPSSFILHSSSFVSELPATWRWKEPVTGSSKVSLTDSLVLFTQAYRWQWESWKNENSLNLKIFVFSKCCLCLV